MTVTTPTARARGGRPRRGHWRLDASGRHPRGHRPAAGRRTEPEDYELCLALLEEAIARAERWLARRERALADFDLRAAQMVNRLRAAGMLGSSTRWVTGPSASAPVTSAQCAWPTAVRTVRGHDRDPDNRPTRPARRR